MGSTWKITIICLVAISAFAQTAQTLARFDAATIKPSQAGGQNSSFQYGAGGVLTARNLPVISLIAAAYGVREFEIPGAPGWVSSDRFDILAKPEQRSAVARGAERNQLRREELLTFLKERFGLVAHQETRDQQAYALMLAKGNAKLQATTTVGSKQGISQSRGRLQGFAARMPALAMILSDHVERRVIDKTGLDDMFDFVLQWTPDEGVSGEDNAQLQSATISVFSALQEQLGLRLESIKAPVEVIVLDHIDRPSEN